MEWDPLEGAGCVKQYTAVCITSSCTIGASASSRAPAKAAGIDSVCARCDRPWEQRNKGTRPPLLRYFRGQTDQYYSLSISTNPKTRPSLRPKNSQTKEHGHRAAEGSPTGVDYSSYLLGEHTTHAKI